MCVHYTEDIDRWQAGVVKLPTVELQTDDGKHEDGEKQQKADLEQRYHGFHDGLQHNLQAWRDSQSDTVFKNNVGIVFLPTLKNCLLWWY